MNSLKTIQALGEIIEKQNSIIQAQADSLAQMGAFCMEDQIAEVNALISQNDALR